MATFSKQKFSAQTAGYGILIVQTATAGTAIHTVPASVTDEIWLYATNNDTSAVNLTIEFGDATATNNIKLSIPATSGLTIVLPGLILAATYTVKAFAGTTSKISVFGYINRIS